MIRGSKSKKSKVEKEPVLDAETDVTYKISGIVNELVTKHKAPIHMTTVIVSGDQSTGKSNVVNRLIGELGLNPSRQKEDDPHKAKTNFPVLTTLSYSENETYNICIQIKGLN